MDQILTKNRQNAIANGKFSIFKAEENKEFNDIMSKVPKSSSLYSQIYKQLKEAYDFGDDDLLDEIRSFVTEHFVALEFQFSY